MKLNCQCLLVFLLAAHASAAPASAPSADWPMWRGPNSSGAADTQHALVTSLDQVRLLWTSESVGLSGCGHGSPDHLATGFCDPIIADGRVYLYWFERSGTQRVQWEAIAHSRSFGMRLISESYKPEEAQEQSKFHADDIFLCLDAQTGRTLWKNRLRQRGFNHRKVYSPLAVPAVADARLYGLGSAGRVYCMDATTGEPLWENTVGRAAEQFEQMREICQRTGARGFEPMAFNNAIAAADGVVAVGDSGSPLGSEDGGRDAALLGFDGRSGVCLWRVAGCIQRWGTPSVWMHGGKRYFVAAGIARMVAIEPATGKVLWEVKGTATEPICDSVTLAVSGDYAVINTVTGKSAGGTQAAGYRLSLAGAQKLWQLPPSGMSICHAGAVVQGGHAYVLGGDGLSCVGLADGKVLGSVSGFGHAYAGYVGMGGLLVDPKLGIVRGWPDLKKMEGHLAQAPTFGFIHAPAVADGRVYLRGRTSVYCYDFRKDPPPAAPRSLPATPDLSPIRDSAAELAARMQKGDWLTASTAADLLRAMGPKAASAAPALREVLRSALTKKEWGLCELTLETLVAIAPAEARAAAGDIAGLVKGDLASLRLGCHLLLLLGRDAAPAVSALTDRLKADEPREAALAASVLAAVGEEAGGAATALTALLEHKDPEVSYFALKALCHIGTAAKPAWPAMLDLSLNHPWVGDTRGRGQPPVLPRYNSYAVLLMGFLGHTATPLLLDKARSQCALAQKRGGMNTGGSTAYLNTADLVEAAYVADPKSAPEGLKILDAALPAKGGGPPEHPRKRLGLVQSELKGTIDIRDPWGIGEMRKTKAEKSVPPPAPKLPELDP